MFTTGQVVDNAVNYTNAKATCGLSVTGDNPVRSRNAQNLTLPPNSNCATPIGPKWVASLTNWLCFLIDGAGLEYRSGSVCQDPLLLLEAVNALINAATQGVVRGIVNGQVGSPPPNQFAKDGDYALSQVDGNLYGPKASGAWPSLPIYYGNNGAIGVSGNNRIDTYGCLIEMGPATGATTYTTEMPTPVAHGNSEVVLFNDSDIVQHVHCDVGIILGVGYTTGDNPINLEPGQILIVRSDNSNWVIIGNTQTGGGGSNTYVLKDCNGDDIPTGTQVMVCGDAFNPFTTTDVGAVAFANVSSTGGGSNPIAGINDLFCTSGGAFTWTSSTLIIGQSSYSQNAHLTEAAGAFTININMTDQRWKTNAIPAGNWVVQELVGIGGATNSYSALATLLRVS